MSEKRRRWWPKIVLLVVAALIVVPVLVLLACKGINMLRFQIGAGGVQEEASVSLGGQQQCISIRGEQLDNPVVIILHGGPGSPSGFLAYRYLPALEGEYTFINWDQRGCGRTYYSAPGAPLSLELMLGDLDDLVAYATERFHAPVYLVGHSWGTVLGLEYAARYPQKIAGYIGIGQMVDGEESGRLQAEAAAAAARAAGNEGDAQSIEALYAGGAGAFGTQGTNMELFTKLRSLEDSYLEQDSGTPILAALVSPNFGFDDLRYSLLNMSDLNGYVERQRPLMEAVTDFRPPANVAVPTAFIGGAQDYTCSTVLAKRYAESLHAPFYEIPATGHSPMFDAPEEFSVVLGEALGALR